MQRERVITLLREHEPELRGAGVGELYLFGSVARDEGRPESDVDVFVDLDRPAGFTLFSLAALQERIQDILGAKVDLMTRTALHPRRRPRIEAQAIRVF
jgi:predicted nucleotidyltransferase